MNVQVLSVEMEPNMQGEDHQTPRMPILARLDRLDRQGNQEQYKALVHKFTKAIALNDRLLERMPLNLNWIARWVWNETTQRGSLVMQLQFLEERQNPSYAQYSCSLPTSKDADKQRVAMLEECLLSSALEEVRFKGTLIERVAMLENRVLQLSLDMEEGSASSSSTIPASGKLRNLLTEKDNGDVLDSYQEQEQDKVQDKHSEEIQTSKPPYFKKNSKQRRNQLLIRSRKLLGWFPVGC